MIPDIMHAGLSLHLVIAAILLRSNNATPTDLQRAFHLPAMSYFHSVTISFSDHTCDDASSVFLPQRKKRGMKVKPTRIGCKRINAPVSDIDSAVISEVTPGRTSAVLDSICIILKGEFENQKYILLQLERSQIYTQSTCMWSIDLQFWYLNKEKQTPQSRMTTETKLLYELNSAEKSHDSFQSRRFYDT